MSSHNSGHRGAGGHGGGPLGGGKGKGHPRPAAPGRAPGGPHRPPEVRNGPPNSSKMFAGKLRQRSMSASLTKGRKFLACGLIMDSTAGPTMMEFDLRALLTRISRIPTTRKHVLTTMQHIALSVQHRATLYVELHTVIFTTLDTLQSLHSEPPHSRGILGEATHSTP